MSCLAELLLCEQTSEAAFRSCISYVVALRSNKKMIRVHAKRIVTVMTGAKTLVDRCAFKRECKMRYLSLATLPFANGVLPPSFAAADPSQPNPTS